MLHPDETAAFFSPATSALGLVLRFDDVVVAALFLPGLDEPFAETAFTFEDDDHETRKAAAETEFNNLFIRHLLTGWDLVSAT
ncbi:hypothetical protein ACFVKC_02080 [Streptomyces noursei]|uniref:hypothetical protein n=1 Tax=Streptomyces noursei TaxID=1971 RepID=UPI00363A7AD0